MKASSSFGFIAIIVLAVGGAPAQGQSAPVVSGVAAAQRPDDSRLVDISYNLTASGPCTVWVLASDNSGVSWTVQAMTMLGDIGANVSPGSGKTIVWDAGADIPGRVGNFRVRVYADDGAGGSNMLVVPSGTYPYQGGPPIFIAGFLIDKYEVTNLRYCEFLNDGDPNGDYWYNGMEISRSGSAGNYNYAVNEGRANYPIRAVSKNDADAYAAWLSARDGRTYRLPTEEEWEKAASWDPVLQVFSSYGFPDSIPFNCASCNFYYTSACAGGTTEVGHYNGTNGTNDARSYYGCYDMSGNVSEWTSGAYQGSGYGYRGGSFYGPAQFCAAQFRTGGPASYREGGLGFRLVLSPN